MIPREAFQHISTAMNAAVIGQETVVERLLIAFLADGHVLMEGLPGVVVIGTNSTILHPTDVDTWTTQTSPASAWLVAVA